MDAFTITGRDGREDVADSTSASADARSADGVRIKRSEVLSISNQLSVMLDTGVTLAEALECVAEHARDPKSKELLEDVMQSVTAGITFSGALSRHPKSFPRIYIALIRAAEVSGMMSRMLNRATQYLKDEQEILRKVKGALTYPAIMFFCAVTTTLFLLTVVMPRFTQIYADRGAALPVPTQVLMNLSHFVTANWMILLPAAAGLVFGGWTYIKSPGGKRVFDRLVLQIPMVGPMLKQLHMTRGLRTIGTMATSGVTLVDCVETARGISSNSYYEDLWSNTLEQIKLGRPFSQTLADSPLVPHAIARMIASGEKGGRFGQVLEQVATFGEAELKERITELTRYIEPVMILVMGTIIGGVTLALLLPVFQVSKVVAS